MTELLATGSVALLFALVHLLGARLDWLRTAPRSIWLSAAGGVSVAYVFVHILPDLAEHQRQVEERGILAGLESHVWLIALLGLGMFYGLERLARRRTRDTGIFWVHLGSFALYNFLIGYLLLHRLGTGLENLLLFFIAMALHFVVNDYGLREHHKEAYLQIGRWINSAGIVLVGWSRS